jgi:hypothetical protein
MEDASASQSAISKMASGRRSSSKRGWRASRACTFFTMLVTVLFSRFFARVRARKAGEEVLRAVKVGARDATLTFLPYQARTPSPAQAHIERFKLF